MRFEVKNYSLVDLPRADHLARSLDMSSRPHHLLHEHVPIVIGDRIVALARETLREAGISWFDLRGHLYINAPTLLVDVPTTRFAKPQDKTFAFAGRVGLAVAVDTLLTRPGKVKVRETARRIDASPSSVSSVMKSLRHEGLMDDQGAPDLKALFWATSRAWKPERIPVARYPYPDGPMRNPALRLGLSAPTEAGWALTGDVAAAHFGAPLGLPADAPPDFYLPSRAVLRLALSILGGVNDFASRRATIAVAPVPAACEGRLDTAGSRDEHWLLARPLFVALDLAQDVGRGSEILAGWDPEPVGSRVW